MSFFSSLSPSLMYLMTKMLVCLALAGLIGLLIGWAIGRLGNQRNARYIEDDWRATLEDTEEDHARVVSRFKKSNQALDDENNNLRTKISALNNKIDSGRDDIERNRTQHAQLSSQLDALQNELRMEKNLVNEERTKNHKLQNLTKALKSSSDEKDRLSQQLSDELSDTKLQLQSVSSLENNEGYLALQREVGELRTATRENAELRQRIATEGREREDALSELYKLRQQMETVDKERADYRQWAQKLEQEQAGFDDRVRQAVDEALRSESSNANDLELEVSRLRPMVKTLNADIERLQRENRELVLSQQDQRARATAGSSSAHIQELQTELNEIGYERDQLRTRLADQERQTASLNTQLTSQMYPPEVSSLRREVAELAAEKGLMSATIEDLQRRLGY
ncbi:hypothetical protein AB833_22620 [Chromatiales bacterium (ex Bugula neritina AB1)]|nr:hypothetical protein AB833_22620 [Chromatiales bacterium (ex Bugula neritina AB1)]